MYKPILIAVDISELAQKRVIHDPSRSQYINASISFVGVTRYLPIYFEITGWMPPFDELKASTSTRH